MTHSSMPQSLPAPLRSLLRDPLAIAVLASIGVHGLLWAGLPYLPSLQSRPTEAEIQREVGLVELSPEELSRVPQAASQSNLPIPAAPLPSAPTGRQPQEFSLRPLPTSPPPSLPSILPPSFYIPPPPRLPLYIPPTAIRPRSTTPTRPVPRSTPTPTTTPTPTPPQASPTPTTSPTPSQEAASPTPTLTPGQDPLPNVREPSETPSQSPTDSPTPTENGTPNADNPNATASPTPSPTTSPTPQPTIADAQRQDRDRIRRLTTPYSEGTVPRSAGDANVTFGRWFLEGSEGRTLDDLRKEEITARYPRDDCSLRQSARVVYGVDVDAEDRIVGDPVLILSSGYPVFDEAALRAVR
ncbi:MAG: hypothetical protein F6K28_35065, partial [Microcoleus sp. SIO2G3]|nr:hypothetical protein [Microcoleus sp. SIO2G3]